MKTLTSIGDSQTDYTASYGVRASDTWTTVLAKLLGTTTWQGRGFGISGDTSTQNLARADVLFQFDAPTIAVIAIGVNDPGASIATATTQANIQTLIMAAKHKVVGRGAGLGGGITAATASVLPAGGRLGERYVVLSDTSTTGGAAGYHSSHAATITGSVTADANGQKLAVWENRYPLAGEAGWGRVAKTGAAPTLGASKIIVVPPPYRNWTTGGDTPSTPDATNATLRGALSAAVTAEAVTVGGLPTVIYSDLYAFLKARIVGGTDPDFSSVSYDQTRSWHYVNSNQHYSAYGHALQAQKIYADIVTNWPAVI
jgi:hypothetical protein